MNEEQHLTFELGITNVPSDATCDDNGLEDCVGLVYDNGEHRVVQKPKAVLTGVQGTLLYIHKTSAGDRYILRNASYIQWAVKNGDSLGTPTNLLQESANLHVLQITSIGKTLILSTDKGVRYYITKQGSYRQLGDIPEPEVDFLLTDFHELDREHGYDADPTTGELGYIFDNGQFHTPYETSQNSWNNFVIGQYSRNKRVAAKACRFINPFFVRVAVEMYDGTYAKISAPILMVPTLRWNSEMSWRNTDGHDEALIRTWSCKLQYKLKTDYSSGDYDDLVKGVVLFMSDQVETQKTDSDIPPVIDFANNSSNNSSDFDGNLLTISEHARFANLNARFLAPQEDYDGNYGDLHPLTMYRDICHYTRGYNTEYVPVPLPREESDIMKDLKEVSIFYKVAELGRATNLITWNDFKDVADSGALETLTSRPSLNAENSSDYYDHTKLQSNYAFVYNNRLNLADVSRSFFAGFKSFMGYDVNLTRDDSVIPNTYAVSTGDSSDESRHLAYVTVTSEQGEDFVVMQDYTTTQKQGLWFYYPDARAKRVQIYMKVGSDWKKTLDVNLREHERLNGAYYIQNLPFSTEYNEQGSIVAQPSYNNNALENLYNYIIASEVNNPFVFKAEGYVQVGVGNVKAVSTITKAISQGQFGGFPLVAFSDNGIWALSISNEGIISTAKPMEREVVSDDVQGITQSDDAVFFASRRGKLMAVVGNGDGVAVKSISEQLCGKQATGQDLMTFLNSAVIAYDYRDSLLWIFDTSTHGAVVGSQYCWIYSIKSGTFARYDFGNAIRVTNVVNNYPDYLLQAGGTVYSLLERPDINQDGTTSGGTFTPYTYSAQMKTRALKLGGGMTLKSIMRMKNVFEIHTGGTLSVQVWAKNDLNDAWAQLTHLRGVPHKYYQLRFTFTGLHATDRFAGTVLITQERRTNKLR